MPAKVDEEFFRVYAIFSAFFKTETPASILPETKRFASTDTTLDFFATMRLTDEL